MPSKIDPYKKMQQVDQQQPKGQSYWINIIILLVIFICLGHTFYDAYNQIQKKVPMEDQQSKLCLAEFKAKNCDPLKTSDQCSKLLTCISQNIGFKGAPILAMSSQFMEQLAQSLPMTAIVIGLLLILQIKALVQKGNQKEE